MAIYGVATVRVNPITALNFYSPNSTANFFREAGTYTDSYTPTAAGFTELASIVTPISGAVAPRNTTLGGTPKTNGGYAAPARTIIQGNTTLQPGNFYHWGFNASDPTDPAFWIPAAIKAPIDYKLFGKLGSPSSSQYGFKTYSGISNNLTIDENFKSMYLHRLPDGGSLRTGFSSNLPVRLNSIDLAGEGWSNLYNVSPNVFFDKPYDKPPIIAIYSTTSSVGVPGQPVPTNLWYIALHSLQKDSNGKYISATVVSPRTVGSWAGFNNNIYYGFSGARTTTFQYLIFSEEEPLYQYDSTNYGLKVNNSFGETVFSSKYEVLDSAYLSLVNKPRLQWDDSTFFYTNINSFGIINASEFAYPILNDYMSITGRLFYTAIYVVTTSKLRFGPFTLAGRYVGAWLEFKSDNSRVKNFESVGYGTTSDNQGMTFDGPYDAVSITWERARFCVDYHVNEDAGFSVKFFTYTY
jgi:hypothetical protein